MLLQLFINTVKYLFFSSINLLNKKRVVQVRALAADIGEGAAGASTLRVNGGWRYQMAMIGDRLGHLFNIRFEIYQKKFFMKLKKRVLKWSI